ncbi:MAG: L,D-transpeptidase family protein [Gammaproteobacteria bacterium]|nr:L,D-transpeptidase family protein [Gammaproteobacteria bacterium]
MGRLLATWVILATAGRARALELPLSADSHVVGKDAVLIATYEDTFVKIARAYDLGFQELVQANPGVSPWLPGEGTKIVLPTRFVLPQTPRIGIVINLPELRLYYFPDGDSGRVITHPISIGRMEWRTPLGLTEVYSKAENPSWYPPQSIRDERAAQNRPLAAVVPPGPDNPLGKHAMRLAIPGYLIHGTNMPAGVGMRVTHGCIRMFPEDIEALYDNVPVGTPVRIVNQPVKLGRSGGDYYLEAHPLLDEALQDDEVSIMTELTRAYVAAIEEGQGDRFDWEMAERVVVDSRGVPQFISSDGPL